MYDYGWVPRSLLLLTVGAVLAYAVSYHSTAFNVTTAGLALIAVGLFDMFLGLCLVLYRRTLNDRAAAPRRSAVDRPVVNRPSPPAGGYEERPTARLRNGPDRS